jgi:uncharacterized protein (TIRG00374 family)
VIGGVVLAAVRYLRGDEVIHALLTFDYIYAPLMLLLSAVYLVVKGLRFAPLMRPLTEVSDSTLVRGYMAGQPATLVPGGVAARVGMMHQVGVPPSESSIAVAFAGLMDYATYIAGTLIAAVFFEQARRPVLIAMGALAVLAFLIYFPVTRSLFGRASGWVAERVNATERWHQFQEAFEDVATLRALAISFALSSMGTLIDVTILYLALRGARTPIPFPLVFLAYFLAMMLGILSPLPGGLGLMEAGMVGVLASSARLDVGVAAAVVAIFRVATIVARGLYGGVVYLCCWRGEDEQPSNEEQENE